MITAMIRALQRTDQRGQVLLPRASSTRLAQGEFVAGHVPAEPHDMPAVALRGSGCILEWQHVPFCRGQPGGTVQVMRVAHHKLVRDQIPEIIAAAACPASASTAMPASFLAT